MIALWGSLLLAVLAGVSVVVQQVLNANLRTALDSAVWSGFASYAVGLAAMTLLVLTLRAPVPPLALAARVPWYAWAGGFCGAVYIALAILLVPRLGAATFVALLVAGQMLASVVFDQLGWFGLAQRPLDGPRALGVALLIAGVVFVRR